MQLNTCGHCGMMHGPICPRIKAIEYHENGTVKRVEYVTEVKDMPAAPATAAIALNGTVRIALSKNDPPRSGQLAKITSEGYLAKANASDAIGRIPPTAVFSDKFVTLPAAWPEIPPPPRPTPVNKGGMPRLWGN